MQKLAASGLSTFLYLGHLMFDWLFKPKCPCEPRTKAWVEERLAWLAAEFGDGAFHGRTIILPTSAFFPDAFDSSYESVRKMLDRVCKYMEVDPDKVDLEYFESPQNFYLVNQAGSYLPTAPAGTYHEEDGKYIIRIDARSIHNPFDLVGTFAHELAHARLLGESRVDPEIYDNELLTDLTVVHQGLGIFLANSPRAWQSQISTWPDGEPGRPEYMSLAMYGWALSLLGWFREERKPSWLRALNMDAKVNVQQGLRYIFATGDSAFTPRSLR